MTEGGHIKFLLLTPPLSKGETVLLPEDLETLRVKP